MTQLRDHNEQIVDQFSQQAEGYSRLTGSIALDRWAALRAVVGASADDLVLDLCCGPGLLALDFAPHVRHATGLDLTPAMLDQARAGQAQRGIGNINWVAGDINQLPLDDGAFTLVLCSAAFHHLEQPQRAFGEMVRVTRPGGRIVIRDVTPALDKSAAYDFVEKMRDPSHTHALTLDELRALGVGLPVEAPEVSTSVTADLSFAAILAASHPETCTRDEVLALMRQDAVSGEDRLGFSARIVEGEVHVSYPTSTLIWRKHG